LNTEETITCVVLENIHDMGRISSSQFNGLPQLIQPQPQRRHFGILAASSAKTDKIFWKIFEEALFTLII
jgi:hypothetical protein